MEGVADLIDARTEAQRRQAVRVLSGSVGQKVEGWRRDLIRAGALLEATIDFADEDVPVDVTPEVLDLIDKLNAEGKTIVLVTHDDKVATRAQRVIHMRDGQIEREVVNRAEPTVA